MRKNKKKSRISDADKELAKRRARLNLGCIALGLEIDIDALNSLVELLKTAYPEDEITADNLRPSEYNTAVNVRGCIMQAVRYVNNLLKE